MVLLLILCEKTRAQYHQSIKYVKHNKNQIKKEKLVEMLASDQNQDFWKEIIRH
jgi:hypothetical protein